jgi:hypothetical protein
MNTSPYDEPGNTTLRRMKPAIDEGYPRGWFVAIVDDQVVAAASDFRTLEGKLREQGIDPRNTLVVEAGVDYPERVTIFI